MSVDSVFRREIREQLELLSEALLVLERRPDPEAVDRAFRAAHTVKGNCGMEGLNDAADLAHTLEDLLETARSGDSGLSEAAVDDALKTVDSIEALVEAADGSGPDPDVDVEGRVFAIQRHVPDSGVSAGQSGGGATGGVHATVPNAGPSPSSSKRTVRGGASASSNSPSKRTGGVGTSASSNSDSGSDSDSDESGPAPTPESMPEMDEELAAVFESASRFDDLDELVAEMDEEEDDDMFGDLEDGGNFGILGAGDAGQDSESESESESRPDPEPEPETEDVGGSSQTDDESGSLRHSTTSEVTSPRIRRNVDPDSPTSDVEQTSAGRFDDGDNVTTEELRSTKPANNIDGWTFGTSDTDTVSNTDAEEESDPTVGSEPSPASASASTTGESDEGASSGSASGPPTQSGMIGGSRFELSDQLTMGGLGDDLLDSTAADDSGSPDPETSATDVACETPRSEPTGSGPGGAGERATSAETTPVDADQSGLARAGPGTTPDGGPDTGDSPFGDVLEEEATTGEDQVASTIAASTLDADAFESDTGQSPRASGGRDAGLDSLTVDIELADDLLGHVRELQLARFRLEDTVENAEATRAVRRLERTVAALRSTVMSVRMMPLSRATEGLARVARDAARGTDTRVEFQTRGTDISLDRDVIDAIRDPLVHMVRNAVDHGIEPADARRAAGKSPEGVVEVRASWDGDEAVIEVADDGAGLDPELIRERAVEGGVLTAEAARQLSEAESYELLFEPGFSTADSVTSTSGRGVGMDVVGRTVSELGGSVDIESEQGLGTTVRVRVPVSMVVSDAVLVESGGERYAVPTTDVEGTARLEETEVVDGRETVVAATRQGRKRVPVVRLSEAFETPDAEERMVLRVEADGRSMALAVDRVGDEREVVVTPYEDVLGGIPGLGGAALLGENEVVNVIDVESV